MIAMGRPIMAEVSRASTAHIAEACGPLGQAPRIQVGVGERRQAVRIRSAASKAMTSSADRY